MEIGRYKIYNLERYFRKIIILNYLFDSLDVYCKRSALRQINVEMGGISSRFLSPSVGGVIFSI